MYYFNHINIFFKNFYYIMHDYNINYICKNFKIQLCNNNNLCGVLFDIIVSFIDKKNILVDIILNNKQFYYLKKTTTPFHYTIPYVLISNNYIYLKKIINTFFVFFKKNINHILDINKNFPVITINNINPNIVILNNFIKNNTIIIDTHIYNYYSNTCTNHMLLKINWNTTRFIAKILRDCFDKPKFIVNHLLLHNNVNELIDIEYTTNIKSKHMPKHILSKKYEILTILNIFFNNFYTKLQYKYVFSDINENYYEIYGINNKNFNIVLNIKILINNNMNNSLTTNEIINIINNYVVNIFIDNLYYIL